MDLEQIKNDKYCLFCFLFRLLILKVEKNSKNNSLKKQKNKIIN